MILNETKTVGEIALENPYVIRAFEKFGIDYCCGGNKSLVDACSAVGVRLDEIKLFLSGIERFQQKSELFDARNATLSELVSYIVETHHAYTKDAMRRLDDLMPKVCKAHGDNHPELSKLNILYEQLCEDLIPHMMKEEKVLFPYILLLENSWKENLSAPTPPFGTVKNPVQKMMLEHDVAGEILRVMREVANAFALPDDACNSYRALYYELEQLEKDLHLHIHLENNLLFPRAVELEISVMS